MIYGDGEGTFGRLQTTRVNYTPTVDLPVHQLDYVNYRGERATRHVMPESIRFAATEWHADPQWIVVAYDCDRGAERGFALAEIIHWDSPEPHFKLGVYRHFKGNLYQVLGIAKDSETETVMVRYRTLYGNFDEWVRPIEMFFEDVEHDGRRVPRFEFIGNEGGQP